MLFKRDEKINPVAIAQPVKGIKTRLKAITLAAFTNNIYNKSELIKNG